VAFFCACGIAGAMYIGGKAENFFVAGRVLHSPTSHLNLSRF
jgi:hypothetical protein